MIDPEIIGYDEPTALDPELRFEVENWSCKIENLEWRRLSLPWFTPAENIADQVEPK